jgi:hypothetical protein
MRAGIEEVVIVEVVEAVYFGLFKLEVDECGDGFGLYYESADIIFKFILFLLELVDVLLISTTQNYFQLLLFDLLFKLVEFLKVGEFVLVPTH